jgi:hypothetical protein
MESAHQIVAEVAGELSLAITRQKAPKAMMLRWISQMRLAADAFEAKMKLAKGDPVEPDPTCIVCNGSGAWETSPEELGWRRVAPFAWVTDGGIRVPATMDTVYTACPCTERTGK